MGSFEVRRGGKVMVDDHAKLVRAERDQPEVSFPRLLFRASIGEKDHPPQVWPTQRRVTTSLFARCVGLPSRCRCPLPSEVVVFLEGLSQLMDMHLPTYSWRLFLRLKTNGKCVKNSMVSILLQYQIIFGSECIYYRQKESNRPDIALTSISLSSSTQHVYERDFYTLALQH